MDILTAILAEQQTLTWEQWVSQPQSMVTLGGMVVALLAGGAGWFSAISAWRSAGNSKKNLGIAKSALNFTSAAADAANRQLDPDFTNAVSLRRPYGTTYVFDVEVANPATTANTVKRAQLTLILGDRAERSFDPQPLPPEMKEKSPLAMPLELPAHGHKLGSLAYEVPSEFLRGRPIQRFRIDFTDVKNRTTPIETIAIGVLT